jgi:hypothetical protein
MTNVLLLNLVFFIPATCGAAATAFLLYRFLKTNPPLLPSAGPDDLALSA